VPIDNFTNSVEKWKSSLQSEDIKYTDVILGMVDILGFKSFINEFGEKAPKEMSSLIASRMIMNETFFNNLQYKILSDTLIVYTDKLDYGSLIDLIFALGNFRIGLIEKGFFTRGSIVKGEHFIKNDIMISPAFLKAYEIEQNIFIYPRIIIEEFLVKNIINVDSSKISIENKRISNKTIILDYDSNFIIYPFIDIDYISLYTFDDYIIGDKQGKHIKEWQRNNYYEDFLNTINRIRDGICKAKERAKTDREKAKANYFIKIYNSIIENLKLPEGHIHEKMNIKIL
jgi:hypothetical protein